MFTSSQKKKKYTSNTTFFQKKPHPPRQHDLLRLQRAYAYLNNTNPSGNSKRKQLRGIQLAQQLVDPHINSIQTVLTALANKITQLKIGYPMETPGVNAAEDNCRRYPCEYNTSDYDAAWLHYVNCLMGIPEEDSIIETDIYNYAGSATTNEENGNEEDGGPEVEVPVSENEEEVGGTQPEPGLPAPIADEGSSRPGFFSRLLNRFRPNNP